MRVVILGAGFGGLELSSRLSEEFGGDLDVVLIDESDTFVFGFSKLDVMFGRAQAEEVRHAYCDVVKPGVQFVQATIRAIDPTAKRVDTDAGTFDADVLVVALGAKLHPEATPGLAEDGYDFYSRASAFALRDVFASFDGGRVVVAVIATPFMCPPAPSETVLLMHDFLTNRGLRERSHISLVMPLPVPIPPSPDASKMLLAAFAERGIEWYPETTVRGLDPSERVAMLGNGDKLQYDLFLGVPIHRVPEVVAQSGMTVDGWVPVNPLTLETQFPGVYAVGDVTSIGTPKAGVFAEGQAAVVAGAISALARGAGEPAHYDGRGVCYIEFGQNEVAKVDVTFVSGQPPQGVLEGPSLALAADKADFGSTRVRRWFDVAERDRMPSVVEVRSRDGRQRHT